MTREPAHDRQPLTPAVRVDAGRQPRPPQRQLGGDLLGAGPLEELDEPFQQPAVLAACPPMLAPMVGATISTVPRAQATSTICGIANPSRRRIAR
jgi:hypothetical protein